MPDFIEKLLSSIINHFPKLIGWLFEDFIALVDSLIILWHFDAIQIYIQMKY
jgi:hypothetical protein